MTWMVTAGLFLLGMGPVLGRGGGQMPDLSAMSDADLNDATIELERVGCYGSCPGYTVTIHGDGRVEYSGKGHVKEIGTREGRIDSAKVRTLALAFGKLKFWAIAEDYSTSKCRGRVCTDMATAITEFKIKGAIHRVNHYYGCGSAPKILFELESTIDNTANSEQWTGDVSKAGPFATTCFDGK
jgi:hypothetical protein